MAYIDDSEYNRKVKKWSLEASKEMLDNVSKMGIVDTGKFFKSLRYKLGYNSGDVDRISFRMPRYAILAEKGVGRGWPIARIRAVGGTLNRRPRPWFSDTMDERAPELADIAAEERADAYIRHMQLRDKTISK